MASGLRSLSFVVLATFLAAAGVAEAAYGLRASESAERVSQGLVTQQLFNELTTLLGHGASHARLALFEDSLRPIYSALPKNEAGRIDQGVARYALHRYFLTIHGWHIRGLAPDGERWNASSSTTMLKSRMPTLILELLEERVGREHIGLAELAVLVATVEDLVHGDAFQLLELAYQTHKLSVDVPLQGQVEEDLVIQTFLLYFLLPGSQAEWNNSQAIRGRLRNNGYFGWRDTMLWLEDMKENIQYQERGVHSPFSSRQQYFRDFTSMAHLTKRLVDGIGMFQDIECKMLKHRLMELEDRNRNDGRVALINFYRTYMAGGSSVFSESPEYLNHLGALDESDPRRPSVIVPNFIYSRSNCLATAGFHSLCCIDECNVLMEALERRIAHPVASPSLVAELVAGLPSDTIAAPRNLSGSLRRKLDRIAEQHSGLIPLHGRMFAQFMHHAFPNECPNPLVPGAEAPMTGDEWFQAKLVPNRASNEQMSELAKRAKEEGADDGDQRELSEATLHWNEEEELVTSLNLERFGVPKDDAQESLLRRAIRLVAMFAATGSLLWILLGHVRATMSARLQSSCGATCGGGLPRWLGDTPAGKSHYV